MVTPEARVREHLTTECARRGWLCWKLETTHHRGLPDWLVLVEFPVFAFVELKTEGERPEAVQRYIHDLLQRREFPVHVAVGVEGVEQFLERLEQRRLSVSRWATEEGPHGGWTPKDILRSIHQLHSFDEEDKRSSKSRSG